MTKLAKFRNSPRDFFVDSKRSLLRGLGSALVPLVFDNDLAMDILEDPSDALSRSGLPAIATMATRLSSHQATRRRKRIAAHDSPTISVIMAAHNAASTIEVALRSVTEQTHRELEILVIDDQSSDNTAALVRALGDPRIQLLQSRKQLGAAGARNLGLQQATGTYLTFHDADDTAHPEKLERQLDSLLATPDAVLCVCNFRRIFPDGRRAIVNGRRYARSAISMLIPRDPVFTKLGYMLNMKIGEDTEYYERIRTVFGRHREIHIFQTLYWARLDPESLLFSNSDTQICGDRVDYGPHPDSEDHIDLIRERQERIRIGEVPCYVDLNTE